MVEGGEAKNGKGLGSGGELNSGIGTLEGSGGKLNLGNVGKLEGGESKGGRDGIMGSGGTLGRIGIVGNNGTVGFGKVGKIGKVGSCKRLRAPRLKLILEKDRARRKIMVKDFLEAMTKNTTKYVKRKCASRLYEKLKESVWS